MIANRPAPPPRECESRPISAPRPAVYYSTRADHGTGFLRTAGRRFERFWFGETELAPVSVFRILFGLQLINWFWQLHPFLTAFFTDDGLLTAADLGRMRPLDFTLLAFASQPWQIHALWFLGMVVAVSLTIGYPTRLASVLSFVLVSLFVGRQPLMLDGSDLVFRIVPLWLAFCTAGDAFAVDAVLRRRRGLTPSGRGAAFPVRVLELQVAWIYFGSGVEKLAGSRWLDGTATSLVFQLTNTYARPWAAPLAASSEIVHLTTWGTLGLELAFLPLVFLPVCFRAGRYVAIVAAAGLHLGILATMNVGNFPVVMLSLLVLFVPLRAAAGAPLRGRSARLSPALATVLSVLAIGALATAMPFVPGSGSSLLARAGMTQRWDMFAPDPTYSDGSLVVVGRLADGTTSELLSATADPFYSRWRKVTERAHALPTVDIGPMFCRAMRALAPPQAAPRALDLVYVDRIVQSTSQVPISSEYTVWSGACPD